jgi:hypothetical protein
MVTWGVTSVHCSRCLAQPNFSETLSSDRTLPERCQPKCIGKQGLLMRRLAVDRIQIAKRRSSRSSLNTRIARAGHLCQPGEKNPNRCFSLTEGMGNQCSLWRLLRS